jgi:PTS system nitrogen regulatory IIA component
MKVASLIDAGRVLRLRAQGKDAVLAELAKVAAAALGMQRPAIVAALEARERLGSTGVGDGVALPHARLAAMSAPVGFFARLERAVDWAAIDARPVDLVFLLLSPHDDASQHLAALAAVTRQLRQPAVARALRAAPDNAALLALLCENAA